MRRIPAHSASKVFARRRTRRGGGWGLHLAPRRVDHGEVPGGASLRELRRDAVEEDLIDRLAHVIGGDGDPRVALHRAERGVHEEDAPRPEVGPDVDARGGVAVDREDHDVRPAGDVVGRDLAPRPAVGVRRAQEEVEAVPAAHRDLVDGGAEVRGDDVDDVAAEVRAYRLFYSWYYLLVLSSITSIPVLYYHAIIII